ncbi:hypothetical protein D3C75_1324730 [compost metagenome]
MIQKLRSYGYEIKGEPGSEIFRVTFDVEAYLSTAYSLEDLVDSTQYLESVLAKDTEE